VIGAVIPNADGSASILGANLSAETRFFFDGAAAIARSYTGNDAVGTAIVIPPPGEGNRAVVTAYNPDGQNSTFLQSSFLPTYPLDGADGATVRIEPAAIPAGADAMIEVTGVNMRFVDGQATVGFGSTDVQVRRVWMASPTRLLANVSVAPTALPTGILASVVNGLQVVSQPFGLQVLPQNPRLPRPSAQAVNANPSQSGIFAGSTVTLNGANLAISPNGATTTITLNDVRVNVVIATPTAVTFQVPLGFPSGPAVLRLFNGQDNALPMLLGIDAPPPVITGLNLSSALKSGDMLLLSFSDPGAEGPLDASRLRIRIADQDVAPLALVAQPNQPKAYQVTWIAPAGLIPGAVSLSVKVDDRTSDPILVLVRGA
jgi:hypothetical protein